MAEVVVHTCLTMETSSGYRSDAYIDHETIDSLFNLATLSRVLL